MEKRLGRQKDVRRIRLARKHQGNPPQSAMSSLQPSQPTDKYLESLNEHQMSPCTINLARIQAPTQTLIRPKTSPHSSPNLLPSQIQTTHEVLSHRPVIQRLFPHNAQPSSATTWHRDEEAQKQSSPQRICKDSLAPFRSVGADFSKPNQKKSKPQSHCIMISHHQGDNDDVAQLDATVTALNLEALLENFQPKQLQLVSNLSVGQCQLSKTL